MMSDSPPGRMSATIGYYGGFVALGLVSASLGPTLPGLAEQTRSHLSEVSYLFTARSFGYMFGALLGGRIYDRVPGHPVMAVVLVTMAAMMALVPLASMLWALTAILLVLGLADGALDAGGNTLLVWVHGRRVGPFMNGLHFCFGVGAFLAPIIVAQALLLTGGIAWAYWALALLILPPAMWLVRLRSPEAPKTGLPSPASLARTAGDSTPDDHDGLVALISVFLFLYVGAEVGFGGWIYTYAVALGVGSEAAAAYLTSAFWGAFTVGRLLAIPLSVRFGPRTILIADLTGGVAAVAVILSLSHSLAAMWLGTLLFGLSLASIFPTTINLAGRSMAITGRITGWFLVGSSIGAMSVPWLIGQFFESVGPHFAMIAILVDLVATAGVFAVLALRPAFARDA